MESAEHRLSKFREERIAREKARIEKLRDINLKKYNKNESQSAVTSLPNVSITNKSRLSEYKPTKNSASNSNLVKNYHVNGANKKPVTIMAKPPNKFENTKSKPTNGLSNISSPRNMVKANSGPKNYIKSNMVNIQAAKNQSKKITFPNADMEKPKTKKNIQKPLEGAKNESAVRKSLAPIKLSYQTKLFENPKVNVSSKSLPAPKLSQNVSKTRESVFDRLYKPKAAPKTDISDVDRLQKDPNFLKKVMQQGGLIANKRHTVFEPKQVNLAPVRRSISAVHFKRISKKELNNCFHKWSSIGEKLDKVHLTNINEDHSVNQDIVGSAIKSERKKVRLLTPVANLNTPRPEELQSKLKKWLKSRGKSIDSYHHLQCFGVHHLAPKVIKPLYLEPEPQTEEYNDENKENLPLDNESDSGSCTSNMNEEKESNDFKGEFANKWRNRMSCANDSVDLSDSHDTTLDYEDIAPVKDVLLGALSDLTELLREGFDWEQSARWLRSIRERFPQAPSLAAYWECRAALEERRGDLPASVQCWEEAIAKGTQHSVVDANLDQLLDKFMQLKISPNSGRRDRVDPKLVDVKNVFKSTIIRFAVQQAKLRQSSQPSVLKYTVTPVRRSARLTGHWSSKKTPLKICSSISQALTEEAVFVPNNRLVDTP